MRIFFGICRLTQHRRDGFLDEIWAAISKLRLRLSHIDDSKLTEEQRLQSKNAIATADQFAFDFDALRQHFLKGILTRQSCVEAVIALCEKYGRTVGLEVED